MAATLLGLTVLGSLAANGIVIGVGLMPAIRYWALMGPGVGIALLMTVILYIHAMLLERRVVAELARREEAERRAQAERVATEARLTSLESRLQPHFLSNALGAIRDLVTTDPPRAQELLEQFASLLRVSLRRTTARTAPLREELSVVWDVLEIEQARLGARLRWTLEVPRDLHGCEVPPFSLQSLVQNSVKYVAATRPDGAELRVEGQRVDGRLELSVWDDGPGFDLATAPPGHGLATLRLQLTTLYGDGAGLTVRREDAGTRVVMWLPASENGTPPA